VAQEKPEEEERWPPKWHVYLMIDPETDSPVYVGLTTRFDSRRTAHFCNSDGPVHQWIRDNGRWPIMVSLGLFYTFDLARRAEERLIAFLPGLVNRDVEPTRRRVKKAVSYSAGHRREFII
jgi:predicted GIY-YIG superfamily endonuclease